MKDMTQGSVTRHLLEMSAFIAVSMLIQTLWVIAAYALARFAWRRGIKRYSAVGG